MDIKLTRDMFEFRGPTDLEQILDSIKVLIAMNGSCASIPCVACPFGVGHMKSNIYRDLLKEDDSVCFSVRLNHVRLSMARQLLTLFGGPQPTKINLTE